MIPILSLSFSKKKYPVEFYAFQHMTFYRMFLFYGAHFWLEEPDLIWYTRSTGRSTGIWQPVTDAEIYRQIPYFLEDWRRGFIGRGILSTGCAPHWAPPEFCNWEYYNTLFKNILDYLTRTREDMVNKQESIWGTVTRKESQSPLALNRKK